MPRPSLLVPALAVALLAAAPGASAAAPDPQTQPARVEFQLAANHDLHAYLTTDSEGVSLEIRRKRRYATYRVDGEATEAGLKAKFGRLGTIDVAFTPTETTVEKPPKRCHGEPSTVSAGVFAGTIEFTGEDGYVRVEAARAKGTMWVERESEWRCPGMPPQPAARASRAASPRRTQPQDEPGVLWATDRRRHLVFAAFAIEPGAESFIGALIEKREGMEISRVTVAEGGASAFVYDHRAGTATAEPPGPFTGIAHFRRRSHGRNLWRSTIRVPLLGAGTVHLGGPGFKAGLTNKFEDE